MEFVEDIGVEPRRERLPSFFSRELNGSCTSRSSFGSGGRGNRFFAPGSVTKCVKRLTGSGGNDVSVLSPKYKYTVLSVSLVRRLMVGYRVSAVALSTCRASSRMVPFTRITLKCLGG